MLFLANDKVFSSNNTDTFPVRPREVRISTQLSHQDQDRGRKQLQLGRLFYAGRREKLSKNCTARFSGFRVRSQKYIQLNSAIFSSRPQNSTHTVQCWPILLSAVPESLPSSSFSSTVHSPQVCECQDCLISPHYHTCQVSPCPCRRFFCYHPPPSSCAGVVGSAAINSATFS